jgi:hypothetical protein
MAGSVHVLQGPARLGFRRAEGGEPAGRLSRTGLTRESAHRIGASGKIIQSCSG